MASGSDFVFGRSAEIHTITFGRDADRTRMAEVARIAMIRHTVDNAVYEAARVAVVPGATALDAQNEARRVLSTVDVLIPSIVVTPSRIERSTPEVSVQITVPLNANSFVPPQFFARRSISRELTLRREGTTR